MSFVGFFGVTGAATCLAFLDTMLGQGITLLDTTKIYGGGIYEQMIGNWLFACKPQITLATQASAVKETPRRLDNSDTRRRAAKVYLIPTAFWSDSFAFPKLGEV